jgi:hypothetical protein
MIPTSTKTAMAMKATITTQDAARAYAVEASSMVAGEP